MLSPLLREHLRNGYGTGVLRAYYVVCFMRGVTVGVVGTSSLFIAERSGVPQNMLIAARGLGLTIGPVVLGRAIGKLARSGESQCGFALALAAKMLCEILIPRMASSWALYLAFFVIGLSMNFLDTSASILVEMVHGEKCATPMLVYCAVYGTGAMVAPFVAVALPGQAWTLLALIDFAVATAVAGRRLGRGKPRAWRARVQARAELAAPGNASPTIVAAKVRLPARVLRAGLAFIFVQQAAETAISSWAFTFATSGLGLPARIAAWFPSSFYLSFTATRFIAIPASAALLPSTIAQVGTILILGGALLLNRCTCSFSTAVSAGTLPEELTGHIHVILFSLAVIGAGTCPLFAMVLASMRQHGEMTAQEHGLFNTCKALGMTMGMWLPGIISLPNADLLWAVCMFLIISSHVRDFPWWKQLHHIALAKGLGEQV
mmetsp:Transcript_70025/g.193702  ORF Transcript_70025/g.193702 Transcript_70025/m.193702 type:complete len:434 (-) Transcript_70025:147-1448(-)